MLSDISLPLVGIKPEFVCDLLPKINNAITKLQRGGVADGELAVVLTLHEVAAAPAIQLYAIIGGSVCSPRAVGNVVK